MMNRIFGIFLFISLLIHASFIYFLSVVPNKIVKKPLKEIELTYKALKSKTREEKTRQPNELKIDKQKLIKKKVDIAARKIDIASTVENKMKEASKFGGPLKLDKKAVPKISVAETRREIHVPLFESEKISNPAYIKYKEASGEKIRRNAQRLINAEAYEPGQVYVGFLLSLRGELLDIKIREEKTEASDYLREIALNAVKASAPFQELTGDFSYSQIPFNVIIEFK